MQFKMVSGPTNNGPDAIPINRVPIKGECMNSTEFPEIETQLGTNEIDYRISEAEYFLVNRSIRI